MSSMPSKTWSIQLRELATSPITIIAMTCVLGYVVYMKTRRQHGTYDDEDYEAAGLIKKTKAPVMGLRMTRKELAKFGSENEDGVYLVALNDVIYDVSMSMDFGAGGKYCKMAGTELTLFTERLAYWDGRDEKSVYNEWKTKLEDFFEVAGILIDPETKSNENIKDEKKQPEDKKDEEHDKENKDTKTNDEKATKPENAIEYGNPFEKKLDPVPEEKLDESGDKANLETEQTKVEAPKLETEIPELSLVDLPPFQEEINSDCDSLRTAYDFLPDQDDRDEETDGTEGDYCEAHQGDTTSENTVDTEDTEDNPVTDEASDDAEAEVAITPDIMWNDADATVVATR